MMLGGAGIGGWRTAAAMAAVWLSLAAPAVGQTRIETITPEESSRPLSFQDWCQGIKHFGSERCAEQRPEDRAAFSDTQSHLRRMGIGPRQTLGCDANPGVNPNRNWVGAQGCHPVNEPPPDLQPFNGPR